MLGNLQIYRKESEPRDRKSFMWVHNDEDGNLVAQVYNGAEWVTIAGSGGGGSSKEIEEQLKEMSTDCEVNSTRIAELEVAVKNAGGGGGCDCNWITVNATTIDGGEFVLDDTESQKAVTAFDAGNYNIKVRWQTLYGTPHLSYPVYVVGDKHSNGAGIYYCTDSTAVKNTSDNNVTVPIFTYLSIHQGMA